MKKKMLLFVSAVCCLDESIKHMTNYQFYGKQLKHLYNFITVFCFVLFFHLKLLLISLTSDKLLNHTNVPYLLHSENIFSGSCMSQQRMELYLWSDLNTQKQENV